MIKSIARKIRSAQGINKAVAGLIKRRQHFWKKATNYWPLYGTYQVKVQQYTLNLYAQGDDYLASQLYYGWNWEEPEVAVFSNLAKHANTIFDVGANIGIYSLISAKENPTANIFAFEPAPANVGRITKNLSLNQASKVQVQAVAVGNEKGSLTFTVPANNSISSVASAFEAHASSFDNLPQKQIEVPLINLDSFVQEKGTAPQLMKVDVELFEYEVLQGAEQMLRQHQPALMMELFHVPSKIERNPKLQGVLQPDHNQRIETLLKNCGYHFYLISNKGLLKVNSLGHYPDNSNYLVSPHQTQQDFTPYSQWPQQAAQFLPQA